MRRRARHVPAAVLLAVGLIGCGGSGPGDAVSVRGTVTLDGKPLRGAVVTFVPTGATPGVGGRARTGADGKYALTGLRGESGVPAGTYRVTVNKLEMPDGTDFPEDAPVAPMDSGAKERLPAHYANPSQSRLTATVPAGGGSIDFLLKMAK